MLRTSTLTFALCAMIAGSVLGCENDSAARPVTEKPPGPLPSPVTMPAAAKAAEPEPPKPLAEDVRLSVNVKVENGKATVTGETNLPDETKLMIMIRDEVSARLGVNKPDGSYAGDESVEVSGGRFEATGFGPPGGLKPRTYQATALVVSPGSQRETVKAVIGREGEHLKGKLVKKTDDGPQVEVTKPFVVR